MDLNVLASNDAVVPALSGDLSDHRFAAVPARLRAALEARGFDRLTDVQRAVLDADVKGRDLQISSQTGSGKTVALGFVLSPPLEDEPRGRGPEALIIVPTRELAGQVSDELRWLVAALPGVRVTSVTGGTPLHRDRQVLARKPRVLVGTPGRLLDHVRSGLLDLSDVRDLVLDEADQMLDMGFREELEGILDATPTTRRTHMVSATFPEGIQRLAGRYQREPVSIEGTPLGDANADIEHEGHIVRMHERYSALVNLLLQADGERTLVFVERRSDALEVAERLEGDGFAALPLSGELAQSQRERTLAAFRAGKVSVLVATDVAARGLDVPDVATVIHTSPPMDAEVYTHRSGRTGRAGKRGRSVLLASAGRRRRVESLMREAGIELRWAPVPDADKIRAQLAERDRATLKSDLEQALAANPSEAHMVLAADLLSNRDAPAVVAALLARLQPDRKVEPRHIAPPPAADELRPQRPRAHVRAEARHTARGARPAYSGRPVRHPAGEGGVRFFMNWGLNQGANPSRLLAAVCRRGEVKGGDIGSIAIHPNASTFDVRPDVAERFERLAGRRDARDPKTRIRRDRGPQPSHQAGPRNQTAPRYRPR
jgi:ATP-dependent RNA helicase DeaD